MIKKIMNNILFFIVNFFFIVKWIFKGNILIFNIFYFYYILKNVNVFIDIISNWLEFLFGILL